MPGLDDALALSAGLFHTQRYVVIRGPNNATLCTTNTVSGWFLAP